MATKKIVLMLTLAVEAGDADGRDPEHRGSRARPADRGK